MIGKYFNRVKFYYHGEANTKTYAQKIAKRLRKEGYLVRITYSPIYGYQLWNRLRKLY